MHALSDSLMLLGVIILVWRFDRTLLLILSELRRLADQVEHVAASTSAPSPQ
jgi:hypothetical protein